MSIKTKQYLFLLVILLANSLFLKAQKYTPFPKDSASWQVEWGGVVFTCSPQAALYAKYNYVFDGDTIIDTLTYKKVYKIGFIYSGTCYFGSPMGYQGAFREDSLMKKAFIVLPGDTVDSLLYDFNLNVGDTVKGYLVPQNFCGARVVSLIDSILVGGQYRKQFHIQIYNCGFAHYVEGIGSLDGLLEPYIDFEWQGVLTCYWVDTTLVYSWAGVCTPLSVHEKQEDDRVLVFPNPSGEKVEISIGEKNESESYIELYNLFGQIILSSYFRQNITITFRDKEIAPGLYFYKIKGVEDNKNWSGKIIVTSP